MYREHKMTVIVAIAVTMAFIMPVTAFANIRRPIENEINEITEMDGMDVSSAKDMSMFSEAKISDRSSVVEPSDETDWWPMFRHDSEHSGYSTSTAPDTANLLWTYPTGHYVSSSPVVADGKVFFGSDDKNFYCLNTNGTSNWVYTTGGQILSSPAVADGKVFFGSRDKSVYCLNTNGSFIWNYPTGAEVDSSPAVADGKVFIGSDDGKVYCLDASNGSFIWKFTTDYYVHSSPAVADGKVYFGSKDDKVYCLDTDGNKLWSYTTGDDVYSSPSVADGKVYFGSLDGNFYCLDTDGNKLWNYPTGSAVYSSPAVADGKVYFGSWSLWDDGRVYCLGTDGSLIWEYPTSEWVTSSPAVADGKVFVGSNDGKVYCLDASDSHEIWKYTTGNGVSSSPAVADGKVFVGSNDGKVYCLGPFYGHDVGISKINNPISGYAGIFIPEVAVKNHGIYDETNVLVNMQITKIDALGPEYNETVYIDIDSQETKTVTFPKWIPDDIPTFGSIDYEVAACTQLEDDERPNNDCKTATITLLYFHDVGVENITQPSLSDESLGSEWLYFHTGYSNEAIGLTSGGTYEAAMRLTPDELGDYDRWKIASVKWYHHETGVHSGNIKIYEAGTSTQPGDLITSEAYTVIGDGWKDIPLSEAVTIDAGKDIWVSVEVIHAAGEFPIGIDAGPAVAGKGDWIYYGGSWEELQPDLDYNWCIEVKVEEGSAFILPPGEYPVESIVKNYGTYTETDFNVNATIWLIKNNTIFYSDDFTVATIDSFDTVTAIFNNVTFSDDDVGDYRLEMTTELVGDEVPENDQKTLLFTIEILDTWPPVTTHEFDGVMGDNDWYKSDVVVTLTAEDTAPPGSVISGVEFTYYKIDSGGWKIYRAPFVVSDEGSHTLFYYSVDFAGNAEGTNKEDLKIDQTSPTIDLNATKAGFIKWLLVAEVCDETSGIAKVEFYVDGDFVGEVTEVPYELVYSGAGKIAMAIAYDNAGNSNVSNDVTPQSHNQSQSAAQVKATNQVIIRSF